MESMRATHHSPSLPMGLERADLCLALAVAEDASVTRAAGRLSLSQSALSRRLLDLESRVGAPLFHRRGRRMVPTALGEEVCRRARELERLFAEAEASLQRGVTQKRRVVRLATECYTCYHWLPGVLGPLRREFPETEVRLALDATRAPRQALSEGRLDLAIVSGPTVEKRAEPVPAGLRGWPLLDDELVAVLPPGHALTQRKFLRPEDFAGEHLLSYLGLEDSDLLGRLLAAARVRPERESIVPLTEALVELVKAGVGVAVLARWAVAPQIEAGKICAVPVTARGLRRRWSLLTNLAAGRREDAFLHRFVSLLREGGFVGPSPVT